MMVNGDPFDISVDTERLGHAVNGVRRDVDFSHGKFEPRILDISLGASLPPRFSRKSGQETSGFNHRTLALSLTAPKEVVDSDTAALTVAKSVEAVLNRDLFIALQHASEIKLSKGMFFGTKVGLTALAAALGEGAGVLLGDDTVGNAIAGGLGGLASGALIGGSILTARKFYLSRRYKDPDTPLVRTALRTAKEKVGYVGEHRPDRALAHYFGQPIVLISAREEEQQT